MSHEWFADVDWERITKVGGGARSTVHLRMKQHPTLSDGYF